MSGRGYHCYKSFSAYRLEVVQKPLHQRLVVLLSNRLAISGTVIAGKVCIYHSFCFLVLFLSLSFLVLFPSLSFHRFIIFHKKLLLKQ